MSTRLHLPHTPRHPGRARGAARPPAPAPLDPDAPFEAEAPLQPEAQLKPDVPLQPEPLKPDVDACKVREAGGPLDEAAYVCECGFAFAAAVSTSVECPHCGSPQAW